MNNKKILKIKDENGNLIEFENIQITTSINVNTGETIETNNLTLTIYEDGEIEYKQD